MTFNPARQMQSVREKEYDDYRNRVLKYLRDLTQQSQTYLSSSQDQEVFGAMISSVSAPDCAEWIYRKDFSQ